jgi:acyl carrier protein
MGLLGFLWHALGMSVERVLPELAEIVQQVTGQPVEEIRPERTFVDELRIDSLAMVEILEGAAQHFGVRIDDEDAKYFVRVRDLADYLAGRAG